MEVFGQEFAGLGLAILGTLRLIQLEASLAKVLGQAELQMAKLASLEIPSSGMVIASLSSRNLLALWWT